MQSKNLTLQPVAVLHSPYQEKFAVPRQPNLVQDGKGILELLPPFNVPEAVRGLAEFSHVWLIFQFDQVPQGKWQPTVRPPRLGGNERIGVFASRATHRPNPIGLSKVRLEKVVCEQGKVYLYLGAVDLVNGTPIFDIKPYIAYADSEPLAQSSFAQEKPQTNLEVKFSAQALKKAQEIEQKIPHFQRFLQEVLGQDPRPAYQKNKASERIYGVKLYDFNVRFKVDMALAPKKREELIIVEINEQ